MKQLLNSIRPQGNKQPIAKQICFSTLFLLFGFSVGVVIKLLDIYTQNLGNIFSQMSIWIFLCTVISAGSYSPYRAGVNVFLFSCGMLVTYYLTAVITKSVYSVAFIYGWAVFSVFTPIFAFTAWYGKGKGFISKIIVFGIVAFMLICATIMFDKIRLSDIIFVGLTVLYMFAKRK